MKHGSSALKYFKRLKCKIHGAVQRHAGIPMAIFPLLELDNFNTIRVSISGEAHSNLQLTENKEPLNEGEKEREGEQKYAGRNMMVRIF